MVFAILNLIQRAVDVCQCLNPIPEKFEFEVIDNSASIPISQENISYYNNTDQLKEKVICDFIHILDQLECGIQPNLEILLEEISLINIYG